MLHTSCRQNIMHEKWGHSDRNGFQILEAVLDLVAKQHSQSSPVLLKLDVLVDKRPLGFEIK